MGGSTREASGTRQLRMLGPEWARGDRGRSITIPRPSKKRSKTLFTGFLSQRNWTPSRLERDLLGRLIKKRIRLDNGCKEGLVASPLEWPGVSSAPALYRGETTMQGIWYDRTAQYRARLRGENKLFPSTETVHLTPLPFLQERSVDEQRAFYVEAVREIELKTAQMHQENGTTPMGARAIRRQKPHDKPKAFKAFPRADYPRREPGGLLGDVQRAQGQGGRLSRRCQTFEARRDGRALSRGVFSSTTPFRGKPGPYLTRFSLHPLVVFHRPEMPFVCPQSDFSRKNQRFEFGTALRR